MKNKKLILFFGLGIFVLFLDGCSENEMGPLGSAHNHADIKVYLLGNAIDFSQQKYQVKDEKVHFENRDGDVVHTHATGVTLGYMFQTLKMDIDNTCLILDTRSKYCSDGNAELKAFVKGTGADWEQIYSPADYVIQDLDKILVTYGTEDEEGIQKQMEFVANKAEAS